MLTTAMQFLVLFTASNDAATRLDMCFVMNDVVFTFIFI